MMDMIWIVVEGMESVSPRSLSRVWWRFCTSIDLGSLFFLFCWVRLGGVILWYVWLRGSGALSFSVFWTLGLGNLGATFYTRSNMNWGFLGKQRVWLEKGEPGTCVCVRELRGRKTIVHTCSIWDISNRVVGWAGPGD